ncbi:MAG: hypothetical protein ABJF23_28425 [Bryobacteraceae bacterium]
MNEPSKSMRVPGLVEHLGYFLGCVLAAILVGTFAALVLQVDFKAVQAIVIASLWFTVLSKFSGRQPYRLLWIVFTAGGQGVIYYLFITGWLTGWIS